MIKNKLPYFFVALLVAGGLTGCAIQKPVTDPIMDEKAKANIVRIQAFNTTIDSTKGTGRIAIVNGTQKEIYKMAWAAQTPNRLRLTLLTAGLPVETIAANGTTVTFVSHTGRHQTYTTHTPDPNLNAFIGVPVRLSEMIAILLGRIPVRPFDRAWMVPDRPGVIHANKYYDSAIQELEVDTNGTPLAFRRLDRHRELVYGMDITTWKHIQHWAMPVSLSVYDGTGRSLEISLFNIIPNAPVKESIFILTATRS